MDILRGSQCPLVQFVHNDGDKVSRAVLSLSRINLIESSLEARAIVSKFEFGIGSVDVEGIRRCTQAGNPDPECSAEKRWHSAYV